MRTTDRPLTLPVLLLVTVCTLYGCASVKPYQRAYLNDAAMHPGKSDIEKFDISAHTYREGASGGGNGKASGGCGCN